MMECEHRAGELTQGLGERQRWRSEEGMSELRQDHRREELRKFQISRLQRTERERNG